MPRLIQRLAHDQFHGAKGPAKVDLALYRDILEGLTVGQGALIELEPDDRQRVVKGRLSRAAGERGCDVRWLTAVAGQVRFQLRERRERREATPRPQPRRRPPSGAAGGAAPAAEVAPAVLPREDHPVLVPSVGARGRRRRPEGAD